MSFFKSSKKTAVEAMIGGAYGAMYGYFAPSFCGSTFIAGSTGAIMGACAIGGALVMIPAVIVIENLMKSIKQKHSAVVSNNLSFNMAVLSEVVRILINGAFAFTAGCAGAAILGLAVLPVGQAALTSALTFGVCRSIFNGLFGNFSSNYPAQDLAPQKGIGVATAEYIASPFYTYNPSPVYAYRM